MNSEDIIDIAPNRTLIAGRFTIDAPIKPQMVHGIETVEQIFDQYNPSISFEFEDESGKIRNESLKFRAIDDFTMESIVNQSPFLTNCLFKEKNYLKIAGLLQNDKNLIDVMNDREKRAAVKQLLQHLISKLKNIN